MLFLLLITIFFPTFLQNIKVPVINMTYIRYCAVLIGSAYDLIDVQISQSHPRRCFKERIERAGTIAKCRPMKIVLSAFLTNQRLDVESLCVFRGGVEWLIYSEESTVLSTKVSSC